MKNIQVRRTAPAHEVEYFIDCAQESSELDACTAMTLRLYGDDALILPTVTQKFTSYKDRCNHCLTLAEIADDILVRLPEKRRAGLVQSGLRNVVYEITQLAETMAYWAIDDTVEGGDLEPFHDRVRSRRGIVFKRTMRRLKSPRFVRRYVKSHAKEASHLQKLTQVMLRRASQLSGPATFDLTIAQDWRVQMNTVQIKEAVKRIEQLKNERKMILRSLKSATSIVGAETVSAFLKGEEIKLIGLESILVVRKRGLLTDRGHGCLSVGLLDRSGTRLAYLCTYIENTPTLDQLSAFALWMNSGEDREVLKTANVIDCTDEGRGHPLLVRPHPDLIRERALAEMIQQLGLERANQIIELIDGKRNTKRKAIVPQLSHEQKQERNKAYWEEMKGHYIEALMVLVIGYKNFPVFKAAEAL